MPVCIQSKIHCMVIRQFRPNNHLKPDYVIEDPMVKVSPSFISVADTNFKVDAKYFNQGRAVNKDIVDQG